MGKEEKTTFEALNALNVNGHTESKNGLTYVSWAWAWAEICKYDPDADFCVVEREDGCQYWHDGKTAWVKVSLTVKGKSRTMSLPVMDHRNRSITVDSITSFDVNKAILRCLVKCAALFGLALYIYAGEDLPEVEQIAKDENENKSLEDVIKDIKKSQTREEFEAAYRPHFGRFGKNNDFLMTCKEIGKKFPPKKKEPAVTENVGE